MKNTIEEIAWISRIALFNDERAFGKLLDKYHAAVRRIMPAQTGGDEALSDDLVQEVFIKVWLNIGNFKMRSSFATWVFRIAYNEYIDYCRLRKPAVEVDSLKNEMTVNAEAASDDKEFVQVAISQLSPPCRVCMTLFYIDGFETRQIAEITGMSDSAVRAHLSRGRKRMKELIEKEKL